MQAASVRLETVLLPYLFVALRISSSVAISFDMAAVKFIARLDVSKNNSFQDGH